MSDAGSLISEANNRVSKTVSDSDKLIGLLKEIANSFREIPQREDFSHDIVRAIRKANYSPPNRQKLTPDNVNSPETATDINIPLWKSASLDGLSESPPALNLPDSPELTSPEVPEVPSISEIPSPELSTAPTPSEPSISWQPIPFMPEVEIPRYNVEDPILDIIPPSNNFIFVDEKYSSELKDQVNNALVHDLKNGGYGINPNDEILLFNRSRDRIEKTVVQSESEVDKVFASRGFPIPNGAHLSAHQQIKEKALTELNDTNREITLERSRLYVQARQFAIQAGTSVEQIFVAQHTARMERALNYARFSAEFSIRFFDTEARRFELSVSLHNTLSQAFQRRIEKARFELEKYEVRLKSVQLDHDVEKNKIAFYEVQTKVTEQFYLYQESLMKAASIKTDIERLKLDHYNSQISAFSESLRSDSIKLDNFKTLLQAETIKLDQFSQVLNNYKTKVDVESTRSSIEEQRFRADLAQKTANLERINQEIEKYRLNLGHEINKSELLAKENSEEIQIWSTLLNLFKDEEDIELRRAIENHRGQIDIHKLNLQAFRDWFDTKVQSSNVSESATKTILDLYRAIVTGQSNALNAVVSLAQST